MRKYIESTLTLKLHSSELVSHTKSDLWSQAITFDIVEIFSCFREIKMQRDESNNSSRSSSSDESKIRRNQVYFDYLLTDVGMDEAPPAGAAGAAAAAAAAAAPAPAPALQGQARALVNPFGPRPAMQGQARALVNPFDPPQGPPIVVHGFFPQYANEAARWRAERIAGRETQDRISNCLGGSQVVYHWPHDPTTAFVVGLLHGGVAGRLEANVHGHALHEFDVNWDWQTPIPTSPWRAYTLGLAVGFVVAWNDVVATNFADDQQQGEP